LISGFLNNISSRVEDYIEENERFISGFELKEEAKKTPKSLFEDPYRLKVKQRLEKFKQEFVEKNKDKPIPKPGVRGCQAK
jgi:hypothetical protein